MTGRLGILSAAQSAAEAFVNAHASAQGQLFSLSLMNGSIFITPAKLKEDGRLSTADYANLFDKDLFPARTADGVQHAQARRGFGLPTDGYEGWNGNLPHKSIRRNERHNWGK